MLKDEIVIHIHDDQRIEVEIIEDGIATAKNISLESLLQALGAYEKESAAQHSGLLPPGCVSLTLPYLSQQSRYLVMEYAASYLDYTYMEQVYKHFPLPRLLFKFEINHIGRIEEIHLGAAAMGNLTEDAPMYRWPLSNVHTDQTVCLGNNPLPLITSLKQLQSVPSYVLSLPCNDDLFQSGNNRLGLKHQDLLELLKDKDPDFYYDRILVPDKTTLKDFIGGDIS